MPLIPKRFSLITSVADCLRESLSRGEWREFLPGERHLCEHLQVSRQTLKSALMVLRREGLIRVAHGKRTRILRSPRQVPRRSKNVALLLNAVASYRNHPLVSMRLTWLQEHLHSAGFDIRFALDARVGEHPSLERLESLVRHTPAACWLLFTSGKETQQWFLEHDLPTLVVGTVYEGLHLPALDVDFEALCRHAVGKLLTHGHRRIALLLPEEPLAGFIASERGFLQGFRGTFHPDATPKVVRHGWSLEELRRALNTLFRQSSPPTGLVVTGADDAIATVGHLIQMGVRIPHDVSVICRDHSRSLLSVIPSVAHYDCDEQMFGTQLARLAVKLARTGFLAPRQRMLTSCFRNGESLGPCPP